MASTENNAHGAPQKEHYRCFFSGASRNSDRIYKCNIGKKCQIKNDKLEWGHFTCENVVYRLLHKRGNITFSLIEVLITLQMKDFLTWNMGN